MIFEGWTFCSFSVKDSCTNRCQVSRCSACGYIRQPVKPPQRPPCVPCKTTYYDRTCWYKYFTCRYNYYKTYGYQVSWLELWYVAMWLVNHIPTTLVCMDFHCTYLISHLFDFAGKILLLLPPELSKSIQMFCTVQAILILATKRD